MNRRRGVKGFVCIVVFAIIFSGVTARADEKEKSKDFEEYTLGEIVVRGERPGVRDIAINTAVGAA